jgi:hypothetical protein
VSPRREELPGIVRRERVRAHLLDQVSPEEQVIAEGRTSGNQYLVVTSRRLLMEGRPGGFEAIELDRVKEFHEVPFGHSTRLVLVHDPLPRRRPVPYLWDIPQWIRRWSTGDRWRTETVLPFNQAEAKAASAIRQSLQSRPGVVIGDSWQRPPWP